LMRNLVLPLFRFTSPTRVSLACQLDQFNMRYLLQKYITKTFGVILSNDILFVLYNLYFIYQIDDLDTNAQVD
jgi:hypothetical protein